jgi:hypothetical protein
MANWKSLSLYETTFDKVGIISELLHQEKGIFMRELFNALEEALKRSVQNKGEFCYHWKMMTQIRGNTLSITFVPALKVVSEKCGMNDPEPSADTIAKKVGFDA